MDYTVNWSAVPGIAASGVATLHSVYILSLPISAGRTVSYFFRQEKLASHLWTPLFMLLGALCVVYAVTTEYKLSRRTLAAVVGVITVAELRYGADPYVKRMFFPILGLILTSILASEVVDNDTTDATDNSTQFHPRGVFGIAALTAYGLLATSVMALVLSVLFVRISPLVFDSYGSNPSIAFLVGGPEAYDKTQVQFWGTAVAVVFVTVVTDATRHREVRWLTATTLIVNISASSFIWYQNYWTATVAAVGALLTVITLALVLDERTETVLS